MRLFIAEKPDLAKAICTGLGGGFATKDGYYEKGDDVVTWCYGHMLKLLDPEDYDDKYKNWRLEDLPFIFLPAKRKFNPKTSKQTKIIRDLLVKADTIVNAGDPDEEGQLLVDELLRHFNCTKYTERVLINDNTPKVVVKALNNLEPNSKYEHLGYQAEARSIADQLFGYNLTRAYTIKSNQAGGQGVISLGRVQTPILGLVVRRCRANKEHKKAFYYVVTADVSISGVKFTATYQPTKADPTDEKDRLIDKSKAIEIATLCTGKSARVLSVETKEKQEKPLLPYNLLKLQQDAARKFGYKLDDTLAITQSLREKHKLITYNRSDCQYLSDEQFDDVGNVMTAIAQTATVFSGAISKADTSIKGRVFNSEKVTAHHAIIPTETIANLDNLSEPEKNIYLLIARSYIAQFFPNYVYDSTTITVQIEGLIFEVNSKIDKNLGWKNLYKNDKGNEEIKDNEDTSYIDLRSLSESDTGQCLDAMSSEKETKPPALYTTATLAGDLSKVAKYIKDPKLAQILKDKDKDKAGEHGGIGTPATRSSIIQTLFDRGYITEHKKKIISTPTGEKLYDFLDDLVKYPDMTAIWHEKMKEIQSLDDAHRFAQQVMADVVVPEVNRLKTAKLEVADVEKCPKCSRPMVRRKGKNGYFWGCTGYREETNPCDNIMNDKGGKPVERPAKKPVTLSDFDCKACGSKLILRQGKSKKTKSGKYSFFGCSNFPECKQSYPEKGGKPVY